MRTNSKRRRDHARRRQLFEQLRLQAEVLCDSHEEGKQTIVLGRMMNIILGIVGERRLNDATRQELANHLTDSANGGPDITRVELGGTGDRNTLYLDGTFRIEDLAKRIIWSSARGSQTINPD
jgi:hypothetical protein